MCATTGTFQFTSEDKFNAELGWETIYNRVELIGYFIRFTYPLVRHFMSKLDLEGDNKRAA